MYRRQAELYMQITLANKDRSVKTFNKMAIDATAILERKVLGNTTPTPNLIWGVCIASNDNSSYFKDMEVLEVTRSEKGEINIDILFNLENDPTPGEFYEFSSHIGYLASILHVNSDIFKSMYIMDLSEKKIGGYEVLHGAMEEGQYYIDQVLEMLKEEHNG